jgi:flagellar biosynthesis/type III secretory pathway protein FliH
MILSEYNEELHLKDTYEVGKADGIAEGLSQGEERVSALNQILLKENRLEDLIRASENPEF